MINYRSVKSVCSYLANSIFARFDLIGLIFCANYGPDKKYEIWVKTKSSDAIEILYCIT